ncbi:hypothetical protein A2165_03670 [Candidatus Curtissbacteria bacterium RBG_13_40_7]|uniref:Uncharacterized protein n=1 Tax=Candidatus Curtissbacteria bacterium RBG_13_40_7 TaxID=1797706 RepID=A0A1F5FVQ3_9BACT|nr:MAG: hypothetical protein A2165_03670 [Candidatus Curtissbacteria bacterium RBG_13_40_7]
MTAIFHRAIGILAISLSLGSLLWVSWMFLYSVQTDPVGAPFFIAFATPFLPFLIMGFVGAILWFKFSKIGWVITLSFFALVYTAAVLMFFGRASVASSVEQQLESALKGQLLLFAVPLLVSIILWLKPTFYQNVTNLRYTKLIAYLIITFSIALGFLTGFTLGLRLLLSLIAFASGIALLRIDNKYLLIFNLAFLSVLLFLYWNPCFSGLEETDIPSYTITGQGPTGGYYSGYAKVVKKGCGWGGWDF